MVSCSPSLWSFSFKPTTSHNKYQALPNETPTKQRDLCFVGRWWLVVATVDAVVDITVEKIVGGGSPPADGCDF